MNESTHTFRGHNFRMLRGSTHPEYSVTCFETEENDFREKFFHPRPGQVVADAGASYGSYSLAAAACGASVLAFEPEPSVFVDLTRNIGVNGFGSLIKAHCSGLWNEAAVVDMGSYAPHWPAGTITAPFTMLPLDRFNLPRVDWLKIDVEGAEEKVLLGARETLARCKPVVIVECHVFLDNELVDKCKRALNGYTFEEVEREPCMMLIGTPKPPYVSPFLSIEESLALGWGATVYAFRAKCVSCPCCDTLISSVKDESSDCYDCGWKPGESVDRDRPSSHNGKKP